jgi:hypothetical protein
MTNEHFIWKTFQHMTNIISFNKLIKKEIIQRMPKNYCNSAYHFILPRVVIGFNRIKLLNSYFIIAKSLYILI